MEAYQIILIVIGAGFLIGICAALVFNKDYTKFSSIFIKVSETLAFALKSFAGSLPDTNIVKVIAKILDASIKATKESETLWKEGKIEKSGRNIYAKRYIESTLNEAGIILTPTISTIIDGAIAVVCYLLPHETNDTLEGDDLVSEDDEEEYLSEEENTTEEN